MSRVEPPSLSRASPPTTKSVLTFSPLLFPQRQRVGVSCCLWGSSQSALGILYASVFKELWNLWMSREDFSHGFLVPLISLYVITTKWRDMRTLPIRPVPPSA